MKSKVEAYLGFAIKKGSAVLGCDNIVRARKRVYLLLYRPDLSPNSRKVVARCAEKFRCAACEYEFSLKNCKAIAVCDVNLAQAIIKNVAEEKNGK